MTPPSKLSEVLVELHERSQNRPITLREVIAQLGGRAYTLLLVLLALPFCTPIPLPGLSTPFGLAIGFIGLRFALGRRPWLPKKLQNREIPPGFFTKVLKFTTRLLRILESFLRPRLAAVTGADWLLQVHALVIVLAAAALLLPLPIPFTNTFPAWTIIFIACGLLERDGLFVVLGYATAAAGVLYFLLLGEAAQEFVEKLTQWLRG